MNHYNERSILKTEKPPDNLPEFLQCFEEDLQKILQNMNNMKQFAKHVLSYSGKPYSSVHLSRAYFGILLNELQSIEAKLESDPLGVQDIKTEILTLNQTITNDRSNPPQIDSLINIVTDINNTVNNDNKSLFEIKDTINALHQTITNQPDNLEQLNSIINLVTTLNNTLNNNIKRLFEIKNAITALKDNMQNINDTTHHCSSGILTTGPILRAAGDTTLIVKLLNNTHENQNLEVTVYNLNADPKSIIFTTSCSIHSNQSKDLSINLTTDIQGYEMQITNVIPGIYIGAATEVGVPGVPINIFRHSDFIPLIGNTEPR